MRFFFYGTLLDHAVRRAVLGPIADKIESQPAMLRDWRCVRLRGRQYPAIVPCPGGAVEGCILDGMTGSAKAKLVRFEGPEYRLIRLEVLRPPVVPVTAYAFVASGRARPSEIPWRFDEWKRQNRAEFMRQLSDR